MAPDSLIRLAPLIAGVYRLWTASLRLQVEGLAPLAAAKREGRVIVYALWHDEMFGLISMIDTLVSLQPERRGFLTMASQSKDGELISRALERLGFTVCRGSSSRGGLKALLRATGLMRKEGMDAAITVDGPRGPRHEVKEGAVFLAHRARALIVPARIGYASRKTFDRAWDRFQLPLPFSRCRIVFGTPYEPSCPELTRESLTEERSKLQAALDSIAPGPRAS